VTLTLTCRLQDLENLISSQTAVVSRDSFPEFYTSELAATLTFIIRPWNFMTLSF